MNVPVVVASTAVSPAKIAVPVKVGEIEKTALPVPVFVVRALKRLAEEGVARKVATFDPRPETPVEIGNPVASVRSKAGLASEPPRESVTPP